MGNKKKRLPETVQKMVDEAQKKHPTDVLGSWTGVPKEKKEQPVQDADDL